MMSACKSLKHIMHATKAATAVGRPVQCHHHSLTEITTGRCNTGTIFQISRSMHPVNCSTLRHASAKSSSMTDENKTGSNIAPVLASSPRYQAFAAPASDSKLADEEFTPEAERKPMDWSHIKWPPGSPPYKLKMLPKVPLPYMNQKPPKMLRMLSLMRGPERTHNQLLYDQFAIIALQGGRLSHTTLEMIRMGVNRRLNANDCFAVWRVEPPWQPMTKKALGARGGGGKGSIHHYVTPIKYGRVIVEVGGKMTWQEAQFMLEDISSRLPFRAMAVNKEAMQERLAGRLHMEQDNVNPLNMKYFILNNMQGCNFAVMNDWDWETWGEFQ